MAGLLSSCSTALLTIESFFGELSSWSVNDGITFTPTRWAQTSSVLTGPASGCWPPLNWKLSGFRSYEITCCTPWARANASDWQACVVALSLLSNIDTAGTDGRVSTTTADTTPATSATTSTATSAGPNLLHPDRSRPAPAF